MAITFGINFALNGGAAFLAVKINLHDLAFVSLYELPVWVMLPLAIVLLDFFAYLAHRSMHKIDWLWRVHRVHHSDMFVDVTTSYR
jgi:sterol desaturase/sphingolipid hydroxylase (fatty acid hydroxylase superfamily)